MQCSCSAGGMLHVNGLWGVTCWQAMCHGDTPRMFMPCHMLQRQVHPLILAVIIEHEVLTLLCIEGQHLPPMCAVVSCKQPSMVRVTRPIPLPSALCLAILRESAKSAVPLAMTLTWTYTASKGSRAMQSRTEGHACSRSSPPHPLPLYRAGGCQREPQYCGLGSRSCIPTQDTLAGTAGRSLQQTRATYKGHRGAPVKVSERRRPTAAAPRGLWAWAALSRAASMAEQAAMGPKAKPSAEATETCAIAPSALIPLCHLRTTPPTSASWGWLHLERLSYSREVASRQAHDSALLVLPTPRVT